MGVWFGCKGMDDSFIFEFVRKIKQRWSWWRRKKQELNEFSILKTCQSIPRVGPFSSFHFQYILADFGRFCAEQIVVISGSNLLKLSDVYARLLNVISHIRGYFAIWAGFLQFERIFRFPRFSWSSRQRGKLQNTAISAIFGATHILAAEWPHGSTINWEKNAMNVSN